MAKQVIQYVLCRIWIGAICCLPFLAVANTISPNHKVDSLLQEIKVAKDDTNKVKTLYYLSKYLLTNEPDRSLVYAKQTLALAEKLNYKEYIFNAYQNIGGYYYYRSDLKLAKEYFEKALSYGEEINDKPALGKAYSNLSLLDIRQIDYSSALDYSEKAMHIALESKDSTLLASICINRGILYLNISDYPTALNYLLKALSISESRNDKSRIANSYHYIGYTYMLENKFDKAIDYFQRAAKMAKESNDQFQLAQSLDKIGEAYQNKKDWNRALDYFQQAITIARQVESFDNIISSTQNIAMVYSAQGKYNDAIHSMSNALELANQTNDRMGTGNSYAYLGQIYMKKKEYKMASEYLEKSLQIARDIKAKDNEATVLMDLATCYQAMNDFKTAFQYLSQYKTVKDSVISNESIKNTAEIEAKYHLEKKEKEIALLTKDKEIQTLEIKKQTFLKNSFIACLTLVSLLFFFVFRNYHTLQLLKLQTLRNKIASDLHDEVGSTLSSISIFSEIARQQSKEVAPMLDQINESSHKMLESMADIVWTINPENDNFEKVILRMRSFAFELLGAKKIDFEFNSDDSLGTLKLPMDVRKNLYLIFKEATNNIVKYAEADRASFSISTTDNVLTMLIRDNGKGFEVGKETLGNGLKNMKNRAMEMGAKFLIESEEGKGTTIQLSLKAA